MHYIVVIIYTQDMIAIIQDNHSRGQRGLKETVYITLQFWCQFKCGYWLESRADSCARCVVACACGIHT